VADCNIGNTRKIRSG